MYEAQKKHTIVDTCIIYKLKQHMVDIKKNSNSQLLESITILCVFNYYITCGKPRAKKKKKKQYASLLRSSQGAYALCESVLHV